MLVEVGVGIDVEMWMGVGRPCPPVCDDIVTPLYLLFVISWLVRRFEKHLFTDYCPNFANSIAPCQQPG